VLEQRGERAVGVEAVVVAAAVHEPEVIVEQRDAREQAAQPAARATGTRSRWD